MNQPKPAIRCARCGAANQSGGKFCNNCGQPLPQPRVTAAGRKPRPARNHGLLWVGGAVAALILLGVCGVGGWAVYQKLTGAQTPPVAQSTPAGATTTPATQAAATTAAPATDAPTAMPTETPASGYILFASGTPQSGNPWGDDFVEGSWDIFVADTNGDNRKLLLHTQNFSDGQFSPNGQWLVFEVSESGFVGESYLSTHTLYVARADGSDLREIYSSDEYIVCEKMTREWILEFMDQTLDLDIDFLYNYRDEILVNSQGYYIDEISSDGQWALLVKGYKTADGRSESDEYSLVNMETGQLTTLGRYANASFSFFPDGKNLLMHSYPPIGRSNYNAEPGYKIYHIAFASWSTLDISGESWVTLLPDNTHILLEEENKLYLMDIRTGERSVYLPGYSSYGYYPDGATSWNPSIVFTEQASRLSSRGLLLAATEEDSLGDDLYIFNGDGSDPRLLTSKVHSFLFFGNKEHILLARGISDDEESYSFPIMDLRSGQEYTTPCTIEWYSEISGFALSPDKIHVLCPEFSTNEEDEWGVDWDTYKLWVLNIDTMEWHKLDLEHPKGSMIVFPIFSSDGSKIVYGVAEIDDEAGEMISYATYVVDLDGNNVKLIGEKTVPLTPDDPYTLPDF